MYKPETQWIGGIYPGANHVYRHIDIEKRIRERKPRPVQIRVSPSLDLILTTIRTSGPISLAQLVVLTEKSDKTVYAKIVGLEKKWLITKELRKN